MPLTGSKTCKDFPSLFDGFRARGFSGGEFEWRRFTHVARLARCLFVPVGGASSRAGRGVP